MTNWQTMRETLQLTEKLKRLALLENIQQHQAEKRDKVSKKKSGRGC